MADTPGDSVRTVVDARGVATVTLHRPDVRNAFDDGMVARLRASADRLATDEHVRVVVLTGAGDVFSAGADLNWMRAMRSSSFDENLADSARMEQMFRAWWDVPKPVIGRVNGHAFGGGVGLVAICDIAVAARDAAFGFTEVTLGLAPAVISPYVVRKIGGSHARALFVSAERFDADRAERIGLVHVVAASDDLDAEVGRVVTRCLRAGPVAAGMAKRLADLAARPLDEAAADTVETIARLRVGDEGQEGLSAFLERRPPSWVVQ